MERAGGFHQIFLSKLPVKAVKCVFIILRWDSKDLHQKNWHFGCIFSRCSDLILSWRMLTIFFNAVSTASINSFCFLQYISIQTCIAWIQQPVVSYVLPNVNMADRAQDSTSATNKFPDITSFEQLFSFVDTKYGASSCTLMPYGRHSV